MLKMVVGGLRQLIFSKEILKTFSFFFTKSKVKTVIYPTDNCTNS